MPLDVFVHIGGVFFTLFKGLLDASASEKRVLGEMSTLTFSFSTKSTKVVLSISTGWPCLSYKASTKWKKLDLRRLEGGCFSKCARASPTPLQAQAQNPAPSTKNSQLKFIFFYKCSAAHSLCNQSTATQMVINRQLINEIKSGLTDLVAHTYNILRNKYQSLINTHRDVYN